MKNISLSVHELVDFVLRSGNLDTRSFNAQTMQEGTRIHNIYQQKQGPNYIKEYPLKGIFSYEDKIILLNGRADGIIEEEVPIIEEIKSSNMNLDKFYEENSKWHLGQAKCYAYLYALEKNIKEITIRLTYISQIDFSIVKKDFNFNIDELFNEIHGYFDVYFQFERILETRLAKRNESLNKIEFPFDEMRKGQEELIDFTKNTINQVEYNFVEAATGIGKTMAAIYSTLSSLKEGKFDKIFYLCPKNTNFDNSVKALNILNEKGYQLSFVEIRAKSKMCPFNLKKTCNPDECSLTIGYYSKLKDALSEALKKENNLNSDKIFEYANKYEMCPFEFSLDLSLYVDFIICDYNYAFHPIAYLKRFFDAPDKSYKLFALVDEAHNLIDRARDMYTISFSENSYKSLLKEVKDYKNKDLNKIIRLIKQDIKLFKAFEFNDSPLILEKLDDDFILHLNNLREEISVIETDNPSMKLEEGRDFLVDLYKFLTIYDLINDGFKIILSNFNDNLEIKLFCIDPSSFLNKSLLKFLGALFFSATLTPIEYFEKVTLNSQDKKFLSLPSPFSSDNFLLLINDNVSIKYKDRDKTLEEVAKEIDVFISKKIGNYIIFVPSFEYLNKIKKFFENDDRFIFQTSSMKNSEKNAFLSSFKEKPVSSKVGFCVISGSFSESIDLTGDRLIGVVVVGVGLPQVNFENNLVKNFYDSKGINGFEFAYVNPGINKVLQAIGRVIRTKNDKGCALLIDSRYSQKKYRSVIEDRFKNLTKIKNVSKLNEALNSFYKNS